VPAAAARSSVSVGEKAPDGGMADQLEELSTIELHDRAVARAEKHLDVKFFWNLLKLIPAAQALSGDEGEAEYDVQFSKGIISDAMHSGEGELGEALRPVFIDYLRKHSDG
jgi:hypothetical protein